MAKSIVERAKEAAAKQLQGKSGGASLYNKAFKTEKGTETFRVELTKDARTQFRVTPYTITDPRNNPDCQDIGTQWYKRRYWVHKVGIDGIRVCCLARTFGKPYPVCQHRKMLKANGASDDELRPFNTSERELFNMYDYGTKSIVLLDISTFLFGTPLLTEVNDPENAGAGMYVSPDKDGKAISCRFDAGTMKDTVKLGSVKFTDVKSAIPQEVLDKAEDLDGILIEMSADEITTIMDSGVAVYNGGTTQESKPETTEKVVNKSVVQNTSTDAEDLDF